MSRNYDVIIIGSGPAGLSAALYASRAKLNVLVLEKSKNGGQAAITHMIENYPGAIEDPTGPLRNFFIFSKFFESSYRFRN